jgi:hypothetical protein
MRGQANIDNLHLRIRQSLINVLQRSKTVAVLPDVLYPRQVLIHNSPDGEPVFQSAKGGQMFPPNARA